MAPMTSAYPGRSRAAGVAAPGGNAPLTSCAAVLVVQIANRIADSSGAKRVIGPRSTPVRVTHNHGCAAALHTRDTRTFFHLLLAQPCKSCSQSELPAKHPGYISRAGALVGHRFRI